MPNAPLRKWVELNLGKKTFLSAKVAAPYLKLSNESTAASNPVGETEEEAKKRRKKEKKEKKEKKAKKEKAEKDDDDDEEEADEFFYLKLPPKEAGVVVEEAKRPSEAEVKVSTFHPLFLLNLIAFTCYTCHRTTKILFLKPCLMFS